MITKLLFNILLIFSIIKSTINTNTDLQNAVNESSGNNNWQIKRDAQAKARNAYREAQKVIEDIHKQNDEILEQRKTQEEDLNKFYSEIGREETALTQTIASLLSQISIKTGLNDAQIEEAKAEYEEKQKVLNKLNKYVEQIKDINSNLVTMVFTTLKSQIDRAEQNDDKISDNLDKIQHTLDAIQATNLLNEIEHLLNDTKSVLSWLNNEVNNYMTSQSNELSKLYAKVNTAINDLEKKDIIIKPKHHISKPTAKIETKEIKKQAVGFWENIKNYFHKITDWFNNLITNIKSKFASKK